MIIDAHHHLWRYNPRDFGWMDETMAILRRDYLPTDLVPEMARASVSGTVVVQARQMLEETRWLLQLSDQYPFIRGVVGWVDLRSAELDDQLAEFASHRKLKGVRHVIHDEPDVRFMLDPSFNRGISKLSGFDLTYDLLLFPQHLPHAITLVSEFPEQKFVLDHMSKPRIREGIMEPWEKDIRELAQRPNVYCKISGMVTEADRVNWKQEDFIPYLEVVLDAFGTGRVMLGSDWPVCRLAGEYARVMEIPRRYMETLNESEKKSIYRLNAANLYQLEI